MGGMKTKKKMKRRVEIEKQGTGAGHRKTKDERRLKKEEKGERMRNEKG